MIRFRPSLFIEYNQAFFKEYLESFEKRPLSKSALICTISALHSDFNPRNIQYITVVKILMRLDLDRN